MGGGTAEASSEEQKPKLLMMEKSGRSIAPLDRPLSALPPI